MPDWKKTYVTYLENHDFLKRQHLLKQLYNFVNKSNVSRNSHTTPRNGIKESFLKLNLSENLVI